MWLKEFESNSDPTVLLEHSRTLNIPEVPNHVLYSLPLFGEGSLTGTGSVTFSKYYLELSLEGIRYSVPVLGSGTLTTSEKLEVGPYFLDFNKGQAAQTRVYVPWIGDNRVVHGGGDNPLLRGGLAMAAFAVEYMVKRKPTSLRYATHLLRYIERCELGHTGLFYRCEHMNRSNDAFGLHASTDELTGLMLGAYYLFLATADRPHIRRRINELLSRLGRYLQSTAYILMSLSTGELHRGFAGMAIFEWALQQAFQRITGERFEPDPATYQIVSERLWQTYNDGLLFYGAEEERGMLLGLMALWASTGLIDESMGRKWLDAAANAYVPDLIFGGIPAKLVKFIQELPSNFLADPFWRYVVAIFIQGGKTYFWSTGAWHNYAMTLHTLQYALDASVIEDNADSERATILATEAKRMIKRTVCGERIPKPTGLNTYEFGHPDHDLYAAVIAKGFLPNYGSTDDSGLPAYILPDNDTRCQRTPWPIVDELFDTRLDRAIEGRDRLWHELPVGEYCKIRDGTSTHVVHWDKVVRWHNSYDAKMAKKGRDFCWEKPTDDRNETRRILSWGKGDHEGPTGLPIETVQGKVEGADVILEAGGLDFLLPRVLMSYWLNYPLSFEDGRWRQLRAVTCLPFGVIGRFDPAKCGSRTGDWLLLSSAMT
jgi:hypothetical protein